MGVRGENEIEFQPVGGRIAPHSPASAGREKVSFAIFEGDFLAMRWRCSSGSEPGVTPG